VVRASSGGPLKKSVSARYVFSKHMLFEQREWIEVGMGFREDNNQEIVPYIFEVAYTSMLVWYGRRIAW
jgi:hypothetical protein